MKEFSISNAKACFSKIIERAQSGRSTVITKYGCVVAKVVPAKESAWDRSAVLDEAEALRKKLKVKDRFKIVDLIERAVAVSGERTKKAAVTRALEEFIGRRRQKRLVELMGKLEWDKSFDYKAERSRR